MLEALCARIFPFGFVNVGFVSKNLKCYNSGFSTKCSGNIFRENKGEHVFHMFPVPCSFFPQVVCVCCFVLLYRYWGIVTVPGSIPYDSGPGVAGSSPSTLTTSLAIPVPSSSSSNGPTTVPLITMGLCHGSSVSRAGPKFVRPHW